METVAWPAYSPGTLLELELSVQVTHHRTRYLVSLLSRASALFKLDSLKVLSSEMDPAEIRLIR
jgi:hypothetical protein